MHTQKSLISATSGKLFAKHRPQTFSQNFFPKFPFCSNFISFFPEPPEMSSAKTRFFHPVPTLHNNTLPPPSRILFLHFNRCTYPVTVERRLLATSVSCPHLPCPPHHTPHPSKKVPDAHPIPPNTLNSPQIKIPPHLQTPFPAKKSATHSEARTIKIRNLRAQSFLE